MNRKLPFACAALSGYCDCPSCIQDDGPVAVEEVLDWTCGGCGGEVNSSLECKVKCHDGFSNSE